MINKIGIKSIMFVVSFVSKSLLYLTKEELYFFISSAATNICRHSFKKMFLENYSDRCLLFLIVLRMGKLILNCSLTEKTNVEIELYIEWYLGVLYRYSKIFP
jgi:hypothetical protein